MGLNQKQAVAALYVVSSILGLSAVVLTASGAMRAMIFLMAVAVVAYLAARVVFPREIREAQLEKAREAAQKPEDTPPPEGDGAAAPADGHDIDLHPAVDADRYHQHQKKGENHG